MTIPVGKNPDQRELARVREIAIPPHFTNGKVVKMVPMVCWLSFMKRPERAGSTAPATAGKTSKKKVQWED